MSTQDELPKVADQPSSHDDHKLHPSEEKFRRLFQSTPLPVYAWRQRGDDFELTDFNNAADLLTNGEVGEFVGKTGSEMYPNRPDIVEDIARCFAKKASFEQELDYTFESTGEAKRLIVQYAYVPPDLVLVQKEDITERIEIERALKASEAELQTQTSLMNDIFATNIDTIEIFDPESKRYIMWNQAVNEISGFSDEEIVDMDPIRDFIQEPELAVTLAALERTVEEGKAATKTVVISKDGSRIPMDYRTSLVKDTGGDPVYIIAIGRDISEQIKLESALRESEAMYRELVENVRDVIYSLDLDGTVTYVSPAIEPFLGLPPERLIGTSFAQFIHPEDLDRVTEKIQELTSGNATGPNEFRIVQPTGQIRWIRVSSRPVVSDGLVSGLQGVMTDITESKRLEGQLEEAAASAERQRLGRELHDSVTQTLYGIDLYSNATQEALSSGKTDKALENVHQIQELSHSALADMRLLIFELQPPILTEKGLAQALRERLDLVEARAGFNTSLRVTSEDPVPQDIEAELYAMATEALNNILKHAHAENVTVVLDLKDDVLSLSVSDDGVGFDPVASEASGGFGINNMRERVKRLEGIFSVESTLGDGSTIHVEVPV